MMLARYRRYLAAAVFLLLATPLAWGLVSQDDPQLIYKEGRRLAPVPDPPTSLAGLADLPREVDAYLSDHFGLRHAMIKLHRDLSHPLVIRVNTAAMIGRDGRMFYQGDEMVRQSAGLILRDARVAEAADLAQAMRDVLEKQGVRFLVLIPPNASTIYQDDLPDWAQRKGRKTEYDLFLEDLAARGVKAVDLRPALGGVRDEGKEAYRMTDAHWTPRGAIAGYDAVVEADGHPDWRIDPTTALGPPQEWKGGDVARILGVQDEVSEMVEDFVLPQVGQDHALSDRLMPDHIITTGNAGPTVVVIGDSFTANYFPLLLSQHVGRAVWMQHQRCAFDWSQVESFHPDEVWYAPTERFLVCDPWARPANFTGKSS
jgi:alginate O-acetyltransferase complex protein AlgJ